MKSARSWGFTLIELLTVIAIIAILAAMTAVALPRVLEKAKLARTVGDFKAIERALAVYASNNGTYPPARDFWILLPHSTGAAPFQFPLDYMTTLQLKGTKAVYDRWADGQVPFVYIPVNTAEFDKVKKFLEGQSNLAAKYYAKGVSLTGPPLNLSPTSPPPTYDAYVLLSVGPAPTRVKGTQEYDYGGICVTDGHGNLVAEPGDPSPEISALRAYFRATRDANNNGLLDFDFRARANQGEGKETAYEKIPGKPDSELVYHLPREVNDNGTSNSSTATSYGPLIFTSSK